MTLSNEGIQKLVINANAQYIDSEITKKTINLTIRILNIDWKLEIKYDYSVDFLREIKIKNNEFYGKLSHVNIFGVICITDNQGLLVNPSSDESDVLLYVLSEAIHILREAYSNHLDNAYDDLYNEYEGYFNNEKSHILFIDNNNVINDGQEVPCYFNKKKELIALGDLNFKNSEYYLKDITKGSKENGIFVKLQNSILPPDNGQKITWDYVCNIVNANQKANKYIVERNKKHKQNILMVLSIPRPSGGDCLLGIMFKPRSKEFDYFFPVRHEKNYLLERNGCNLFTNKKIMIIGCGSVGSEVVYQLVKCGVNNLMLIDNDKFELDNLYRHRLDIRYLNKNKAEAIKLDLLSTIPYLSVKSLNNLWESMKDEELKWGDLIISLTGCLNTNLRLDQKCKKLNIPVIYGWIDGVGVGGHAALIQNYNNSLENLFEDNGTFNYKYALIKPDQKISQNLTGCAGSFVPFSYTDVCQTASLVIKLVQEHDPHHNTKNINSTWFGTNSHFIELTEYYLHNKDKYIIEEIF